MDWSILFIDGRYLSYVQPVAFTCDFRQIPVYLNYDPVSHLSRDSVAETVVTHGKIALFIHRSDLTKQNSRARAVSYKVISIAVVSKDDFGRVAKSELFAHIWAYKGCKMPYIFAFAVVEETVRPGQQKHCI